MKIDWNGKLYNYDPNAIDVRQAMGIWSHTGLGLVSWESAVKDMRPDALVALVWVMKQQNGEVCAINELEFELIPFMRAMSDAIKKELEEIEREEEDAPKDSAPDLTGTPTQISGDSVTDISTS